MKKSDYKALKTHFAGAVGRGRTTTLIEKSTSKKVGEWIGCLTLAECLEQYKRFKEPIRWVGPAGKGGSNE